MRETRCFYRSERVLKRIVYGESSEARSKDGKRLTLRKAPAARCIVWQFRDEICTVQIGSVYYKRIWSKGTVINGVRYSPLEEINYFRQLCAQLGVAGNPSSYSWLWRKLIPRLPSRVPLGETSVDEWDYPWAESWPPHGIDGFEHGMGQAGALAKPLQLPRETNRWVRGPWSNYDIRCAYGWSVCQGVPDPRRGRRVKRPTKRATHGVYRVALPLDGDRRMLPPGLRGTTGHAWITREDLERFCVRWESVTEGVEFRDTWELGRTIDTLRKLLPDVIAKSVVRTGWGGWHSDAALVQAVYEGGKMLRFHELRPMRQPELSAHVIGRVNGRMGDVASGAAQILTDSVLTRDRLQLGSDWGQWREDGPAYPAIFVDGTGRWFSPDGPVKRAGLAWDAAIARWNQISKGAAA